MAINKESQYESITITARGWQEGEFEEVTEKIKKVCEEYEQLEIEEKSGKLSHAD